MLPMLTVPSGPSVDLVCCLVVWQGPFLDYVFYFKAYADAHLRNLSYDRGCCYRLIFTSVLQLGGPTLPGIPSKAFTGWGGFGRAVWEPEFMETIIFSFMGAFLTTR